jgi:hypothetical protein
MRAGSISDVAGIRRGRSAAATSTCWWREDPQRYRPAVSRRGAGRGGLVRVPTRDAGHAAARVPHVEAAPRPVLEMSTRRRTSPRVELPQSVVAASAPVATATATAATTEVVERVIAAPTRAITPIRGSRGAISGGRSTLAHDPECRRGGVVGINAPLCLLEDEGRAGL